MLTKAIFVLLSLCSTTVADSTQSRSLFDFSNSNGNAADQWQTVNDGVMGGRSEGNFRISGKPSMEFFGTLSLENNGGFASVDRKSVV